MLFAKVVLALMLDRPAEGYLDTQRAAHLQRMRELTELKRTGGLVDALLADHGLFHLEADLRWIDLTAARLDALGEGGAVMTAASANQRTVRSSRPATSSCRSVRRRPCAAPAAVNAGEILAVMGPTGSGKSTLLHCLAGILVPTAGEVCFAGERLDTLGEDERSALRRDRFGFVFQFGQLVPELTAEENVALPLLLAGVRRAAALHRRPSGSSGSTSTGSSSGGPGSCRAGRRSASRWPAAWSPGRRCCSPTSRPGRWTRSPAST